MTADRLVLATDRLALSARLLAWDTESLGAPVAQVDAIEVRGPGVPQDELARLQEWLRDHRVALASCRLPENRLPESFFLEDAGFRFIEMVYRMHRPIEPADGAVAARSDVRWEHATRHDLPELMAVAAAVFDAGRWNVDPRVGAAASRRRYAHWVERSLAGGAQQVLLARDHGAVAGFFIMEDLDDTASYWHLTAISPQYQGRGWGRRLWTSMIGRHAAAGRRSVRTTIAARNLPVVNLYARQGWRFEDCQMTFHWTAAQRTAMM